MSTFGQRLREAREEAGLTQEQVGNLFDPPVTRNTVSNWERDENMPDADRLPTLARGVRRRVDFLLTGRGPKTSGGNTDAGPDVQGRVPIISWVRAGQFCESPDEFSSGHADEWTPTTVPIHQHTFALRVKGDSMTNPLGEPNFPHGSVIVIEPNAVDSWDKLVGAFVIVKRLADGEATFKQLVRDGGKFYLKPLNPQYPMLELRDDDRICGVVRERVMRFF